MDEAELPDLAPPRGVAGGVWQYIRAEHIAEEFDEYFAGNRLFEFDAQVLARHFTRPGLVVDLGCGTGRTLIPLARRGFRGLGIDLSRHMLRITGRKAAREDLPIALVQANLVELDCIRSESADYCTCLFSTLGMIRGRANRDRMLGHAWRIMKPGGLFVLHVHNLWYHLFASPADRRWLVRHLVRRAVRRDVEWGDKTLTYRGIPDMFLHTFTRRQLNRALSAAGFRIVRRIPLAPSRLRPLGCRWFFESFRANGWIVVCEKGRD